tara:strand:- start:1950 stop:2939 length:990 start_codon:yes stop_codon:yes gene_type:complete
MNWGIIGLGNMAKKFAISINQLENTALLGISSSSFFKRKKFGFKFNIKNKYQFKNDESIFNCDEIENIYIATTNNFHFDLIMKGINAKKNILCEKPLTINYKDSLTILEKLKKSKIFLMEAIAYRTHPQIEFVIKKIKENTIGQILKINSTFGFKVKKINKQNRLFNKQLGGGAILDVGCYPVSMSNLIANINNNDIQLPEISDVSGAFYETGVDESASATFKYQNGITSHIHVAINKNMENKTIIEGTEGKILIPNPWLPTKDSYIEINKNGKSYNLAIKSKFDLFTGQINNVNESIRKGRLEGKYPAMSWINSANNMLIIDKWKNLL